LYQKTINKSARYRGIGIFFGKETKIILSPAPANTGIVFNGSIQAKVKNAFIFNHSLGMKRDNTKIFFTEHLLAACYGLGINNLFIDVSGKELPFGEGSALTFVNLIKSAGIKTYQKESPTYNLDIPMIVNENDSFICALPDKKLSIDCFVDFPHSKIGKQFWGNIINLTNFENELAPARTFGTHRNYALLKKILPFKLSIANGLIFPKIRRYRNEAVRHKVLDLIGHLTLLGSRLNAKIFAFKPSHEINQGFVKKLEGLYEN
jgi:UDP-3-O-acyl N-acetylglucosamine deacetylase